MGTFHLSTVHKMVQTSLEMEMLMSQSRNVCPANLPGSTYGGESASVASPQVDGTTYLYRGKLVCCVGSRSTFIL